MHENDTAHRKLAAISSMRRLAVEINKTPTIIEYKRSGLVPTYDMVIADFGSWRSFIDQCALPQNPYQKPPSNRHAREELIREFIRVANLLKRLPSLPDFRHHANISKMPYVRQWGSWESAKLAISQEGKDRFDFNVNFKPYFSKSTAKNRRRLDLHLPMIYCPENETETIILFSMVANFLGYQIVSGQIAYPDLTLLKDGNELKCEVEYLSSTYYAHGHPLDKESMCLCWRLDKEIPEIREVLSLESLWIQGKLSQAIAQQGDAPEPASPAR
jgi:hypothetical protein